MTKKILVFLMMICFVSISSVLVVKADAVKLLISAKSSDQVSDSGDIYRKFSGNKIIIEGKTTKKAKVVLENQKNYKDFKVKADNKGNFKATIKVKKNVKKAVYDIESTKKKHDKSNYIRVHLSRN